MILGVQRPDWACAFLKSGDIFPVGNGSTAAGTLGFDRNKARDRPIVRWEASFKWRKRLSSNSESVTV